MALIDQWVTPFGTVKISKSKQDGTLTYYQNGCFHSQSDRNGTSLCAYSHVIVKIIAASQARNILVIGCAGGNHATMLRKIGCKVTIVDINPVSFVIARRYFRMPADVSCLRKDGVSYIKESRRTYDGIVIDVFQSNSNVPFKFTTPTFFKQLVKRLSPKGVVIMNMMTKNDQDLRGNKVASNLAETGVNVRLFESPGESDRNTLIVGNGAKYIDLYPSKSPLSLRAELRGIRCFKLQKRPVSVTAAKRYSSQTRPDQISLRSLFFSSPHRSSSA